MELAVARLAASQHGVVTRRQLLALGMTPEMVRGRRRIAYLQPLHRGVYAVGHRLLRREGVWLAAVLAVGDDAALSHREAAALHGLRPSNRASIDVTTPSRNRRSLPRVTVHPSVLDPRDVTVLDGVRVTTVARTLVDLAGVVPADHVARALDAAERLGTLDVRAIDAARGRVRTRRGHGHAVLAAVLAAHARHGATDLRSTLEARFLALCEEHGLPRPRCNLHVGRLVVDACWPDRRLAVELDGWEFHRTRGAFQRDREKGNALARAGWTVLRFTHTDVTDRPRSVADALRGWLTDG